MTLISYLIYFNIILFWAAAGVFLLSILYHLYLYWQDKKLLKLRKILIPELAQFIFAKNNREKLLAVINNYYFESLSIIRDYLSEITGESYEEIAALFLESPKIKKLQRMLYSPFTYNRLQAAYYLAEIRFHPAFYDFVKRYEKIRLAEEKYFYLKGMVKLSRNLPEFSLTLEKIKESSFSLAEISGLLADASEEIVPLVFFKLKEEKNNKYKILFIEFLKSRNFPELGVWLCDIGVKEEDPEVLVTVIKALGSLGLPRSVPLLINLLKSDNWVIRAQAAKSLGLLRINEALPYLVERLSDENWWVRYNAGNAILNFGPVGYKALQTVIESASDRFAHDMANYLRTKYLFARGLKYGTFNLKNL